MTMAPIALLGTALLTVHFLAMTWAMRGHFRTDVPAGRGMRLIAVASALAMAWFAVGRTALLAGGGSLPPWREWSALGIAASGLGLFGWTLAATRQHRLTLAFSGDTPSFLLEAGPYGVVRHPFYVSYVLFWIAAALQVPERLLAAVPAGMAVLYGIAAREEEGKFARSPLAAHYARYRARVGFLPWRR